jgi:hypothetical protein
VERRAEGAGVREYKAIVWTDDESSGKRITLLAETLEEAQTKLRDEYGLTATISLWNEDDAHRPRNSK